MDYAELLFAATVQNLAHSLRRTAAPTEVVRSNDETQKQWFAEHPLSDFVPIALEQIQDTAKQIKSLAGD